MELTSKQLQEEEKDTQSRANIDGSALHCGLAVQRSPSELSTVNALVHPLGSLFLNPCTKSHTVSHSAPGRNYTLPREL